MVSLSQAFILLPNASIDIFWVVDVTGGGTGTPSPLVTFPGEYTGYVRLSKHPHNILMT